MRGYAHSKNNDKRKYPLRKVIERDIFGTYNTIPNRRLNKLECGHLIPPAKDFYGDIHSVSQRCKECFKEQHGGIDRGGIKKSKKMSLKEKIYKWLQENASTPTPMSDIKQTNISFRLTSYRASYYFQYAGWISSYTMKRWIEIAENEEYDSWETTYGDWRWMKNNRVIN